MKDGEREEKSNRARKNLYNDTISFSAYVHYIDERKREKRRIRKKKEEKEKNTYTFNLQYA
jgi:hypothetical protein